MHGEVSYHLTTTKTPNGDMSYGRIKFPDCIHHYTLNQYYDVMMVEVFNYKGQYLRSGDELCIEGIGIKPPRKSYAIMVCKAMVEWHLNDDYPLNLH